AAAEVAVVALLAQVELTVAADRGWTADVLAPSSGHLPRNQPEEGAAKTSSIRRCGTVYHQAAGVRAEIARGPTKLKDSRAEVDGAAGENEAGAGADARRREVGAALLHIQEAMQGCADARHAQVGTPGVGEVNGGASREG